MAALYEKGDRRPTAGAVVGQPENFRNSACRNCRNCRKGLIYDFLHLPAVLAVSVHQSLKSEFRKGFRKNWRSLIRKAKGSSPQNGGILFDAGRRSTVGKELPSDRLLR